MKIELPDDVKMYKTSIPNDLKRFAVMAFLKRFLPLLILEVAVTVFAVLMEDRLIALLFGNVMLKEPNIGYKVAAYIAVFAVPFMLTGFPYRFLDKTYWGRVLSVRVKTTYSNEVFVRRLYQVNVVLLDIATKEKILHNVLALKCKVSETRDLDKYKKGDVVFHLYGTKHIVKLPDDGRGVCPVCENVNDGNEGKCDRCGHSVLKLSDFDK